MKLGFIGTGKITSAVVTGICSSNISYKNIIISHRNKSIAQRLKKMPTHLTRLLFGKRREPNASAGSAQVELFLIPDATN